MFSYIFPKNHDSELTRTQQEVAEIYRNWLLEHPPCLYGIFTFEIEPPDLDAALGHVDDLCKRVSGELHRPVWYLATGERRGLLDRRHCHVFLWSEPSLDFRDCLVIRKHWWLGRIESLGSFTPGGGAEWYMAAKIAAGRERAWDMSKKLARRIGKLRTARW